MPELIQEKWQAKVYCLMQQWRSVRFAPINYEHG